MRHALELLDHHEALGLKVGGILRDSTVHPGPRPALSRPPIQNDFRLALVTENRVQVAQQLGVTTLDDDEIALHRTAL